MPFARWETFAACTREMINTGHTEESANNICGSIQARAEKGELYKATDVGLQVLSKANEPDLVVGGWATWELVDPERDIITVQAQSKALQRFFKQAPEFQSITVNHKEFKLAQPILKYVDSTGKEYFSHVNEKGTFLVSKIRDDDQKTTQYYREKVRKGEITGYSISGPPLSFEMIKAEDGQPARRVDDVEYWAITLCEKGVVKAVNPKAEVSVISKSVENPQILMKTVEKRGNQYCVVHCHGPNAGEVIKCFDTKEEADAMHAAIQANKAEPTSKPEMPLDAEQILQKYGFNKTKRP